ncbi:MAG: nucleotidyltransferase family protein [Bdellovibrionota bacterium]
MPNRLIFSSKFPVRYDLDKRTFDIDIQYDLSNITGKLAEEFRRNGLLTYLLDHQPAMANNWGSTENYTNISEFYQQRLDVYHQLLLELNKVDIFPFIFKGLNNLDLYNNIVRDFKDLDIVCEKMDSFSDLAHKLSALGWSYDRSPTFWGKFDEDYLTTFWSHPNFPHFSDKEKIQLEIHVSGFPAGEVYFNRLDKGFYVDSVKKEYRDATFSSFSLKNALLLFLSNSSARNWAFRVRDEYELLFYFNSFSLKELDSIFSCKDWVIPNPIPADFEFYLEVPTCLKEKVNLFIQKFTFKKKRYQIENFFHNLRVRADEYSLAHKLPHIHKYCHNL